MLHFRIPRPRLLAAAFALVTLLIIASSLTYILRGYRHSYRTFRFASIPDHVCGGDGGIASPSVEPSLPIPNLVHYVWLLRDPAELRLGLQFFLSVYSAHILWHPERIYIHTDATPEVVSKARVSGTAWTKRILGIPGLTVNYVKAPLKTRKGVDIINLQHRADFVRIDALRDHGGVYLDADAVPLRDIAALRNSGFRNVVGQQTGITLLYTGYINNGVMMSVPQSSLMTVFYHAAHEFFDGEWETASIKLLTDLANRMSSVPSEVIILQAQAFNPTSWEYEDQKRMFLPVMDSLPYNPQFDDSEQDKQQLATISQAGGTCEGVMAWLKQRESNKAGGDWALDFSSTFVLHAINGWASKIVGRDIDVDYILARQSNYARAVFPALWRAIQEGIVPPDEVGGRGP